MTNDQKGSRGNFFAVDRRCMARACGISLNTGCAYLVLACGTSKDNVTTHWSAEALEKRTGISRRRAKDAVQSVVDHGLAIRIRDGNHPIYKLTTWADFVQRGEKITPPQEEVLAMIGAGFEPDKSLHASIKSLTERRILVRDREGKLMLPEPEQIWLPNEFVSGAADETPPLELVRQTQDAMALRLAVDQYYSQSLREDGGVGRHVTFYEYKRCNVAQQGPYTVYGFQPEGRRVYITHSTAAPHRNDLTEEEFHAGESYARDFFRRQQMLHDAGIFQWVTYLFESDEEEAEMIHPLQLENAAPDCLENQIGAAAHSAALGMLTERQKDWALSDGLILVPVLRHQANVQAIGIARAHYRPKTKMTAAWWAELNEKGRPWLRLYSDLEEQQKLAAAS